MRWLLAPLILIVARARGQPGRWFLPVLGLALATAFAGAVLAEATIAGDVGARSVLSRLTPLQRSVRVSWQGVPTPSVQRRARALLKGIGLGAQTEVTLLNPVRLSGVVVRPAAIEPLGRWIVGRDLAAPGSCGSRSCSVLLASGTVPRTPLRLLRAAGVRLHVLGRVRLRSAAPLGFLPGSAAQPPLILSGDVDGLGRLSGLSGLYRTHSWIALLPVAHLNSWQLAVTERRLQRAQAGLLQTGSQFALSAPFSALDGARQQASAAPRRLLLTGGGALAALAMFTVLAAYGLRSDQRTELARLRTAGAHRSQGLIFVLGEAAWLSAVALLIGACLAIAGAALLAGAAGVSIGGVLAHSLLAPVGAAALACGWICATVLITLVALLPGGRIADLLAVAAVAALALALTRGAPDNDPLAVLLAPLCCLAAGVLIFRAATALLERAERLWRRGPVLPRLALVGLARAPIAPSLAIAFIAVSTGLGGFALAYRATLLRGTADQAADQVPLDATVSPAADFTTPLQLAPLARWRAIADGEVLPVRRTEATYASDGATVTVPALGVPATGLAQVHGWRSSDGSAPLPILAARLKPVGTARTPGPLLHRNARWLSLRLSAPAIAVTVTADLRNGEGTLRQLALGAASAQPRTLRVRLPRGSWELEALELDEPTGLEATNGHQNGENPAAATQSATAVTLGPLLALDRSSRRLMTVSLGEWRAVGAASRIGRPTRSSDRTGVRFTTSGAPGLLRPVQPSDLRPLPVLVDQQTAGAAARAGRLGLTVDDQPVSARIVGVLARFPTLAPDASGFVVADESALASALDAQLPGQGRADELWITTRDPGRLQAALRSGAFDRLTTTFRADVQHDLRSAPIARGVLGTLVAATALSGALAVLGLLVALLGPARDRRVERDLAAQGLGPGGLRRELRLRILVAGGLGVGAGLALAVVLTRLAVASVQAAATVATPLPALVTVAPWGELALWGASALLALAAASLLATGSLVGRRGVG